MKKYKEKIMTLMDIALQTLLLFATSLVTFIFTKRKYNSEARAQEITNIDSSLKVYQNIILDLETRLERLQKLVGELELKLERCQEENKQLKIVKCKFPDNPKC